MPRMKLTKRSDGYFKVKYKGKQFYGRTQAEANAKRDEYIAREKAGQDHEYDKATFLGYALNWVKVYRADCSRPQQKQYLTMMTFAADTIPQKLLKDITSSDVQVLCNRLNAYSVSHAGKFMTTLRGVFATAAAEGAILRNPMLAVRKPKPRKSEGHRALEQWERTLIRSTWQEHDFGPAAMVMMYAGLRRGEVLYLDVDRDVDFEKKTITVRGGLAFPDGNHAIITPGKTDAAQRVIPMVKPLEQALEGRHGLLCTKEDGGMVTMSAFDRKYESYLCFLETRLNGCHKRWYGKTCEHKALLAEGKELPPWRDVNIRCHDFRVDFCTRNYEAGTPIKTLQKWMGHADAKMIMNIYAKLTEEHEAANAKKLMAFMDQDA